MANNRNGLLALLGLGAIAYWRYKNATPEEKKKVKEQIDAAKSNFDKLTGEVKSKANELGSDLKTKASELSSEAKAKADELGGELKSKADELKGKAEDLSHKAQERVNETR